MTNVWRIVKGRHLSDAFDGEGASQYPGRWNLSGTPMVYAAGSLSLAALELFVHIGSESTHIRFISFRIDIPKGMLVERLEPDNLPHDWRRLPAPDSTKESGTKWAQENKSAVLRVPSIIIPVEYNYLLNPAHPDFERIHIEEPRPFSFDVRMWK